MIQTEVTNDSVNAYTKRCLAPAIAYWWRYAKDQRDRRGIAKATIDTFLDGKNVSAADQTDLLSNITA